jgi:excisionase family DNA binding protein
VLAITGAPALPVLLATLEQERIGVIRFDDLADVLTPTEVQSFLRLGRNATYDLLRNGRLRSVRLGQKYLVPREAVRELLHVGVEGRATGTPVKGTA